MGKISRTNLIIFLSISLITGFGLMFGSISYIIINSFWIGFSFGLGLSLVVLTLLLYGILKYLLLYNKNEF